MSLFTYTPAQADALAVLLPNHPWEHYWRRVDSTLNEFEIDQQGMHPATATQSDCESHWLIVLIGKCTIQAMIDSPHAWRDHRLRLMRECGIPYW